MIDHCLFFLLWVWIKIYIKNIISKHIITTFNRNVLVGSVSFLTVSLHQHILHTYSISSGQLRDAPTTHAVFHFFKFLYQFNEMAYSSIHLVLPAGRWYFCFQPYFVRFLHWLQFYAVQSNCFQPSWKLAITVQHQ